MKTRFHAWPGILYGCAFAACVFLSGCAAPKYTVDDGSAVDEELLSSIRSYGKAEQAIRPGIVKSAQLKDPDCDKQWELPFAVMSSYKLPQMEKIAWVRGLQVDERLSVVAATPESGLKPGDKITHIDGDQDDPDDMQVELLKLREAGTEFTLTLHGGKKVGIKPVEVCRGRVEVTRPHLENRTQEYHWLRSRHASSLFNQDLTPDEAMWAVLWTQGLSEEAGVRMKTYHYGMGLVKTAFTVASVASGVGAAANAASAAAAQYAASEAGKAAALAAGKELAKFTAQQIADSVREKIVTATAKEIAKFTAQEVAMNALRSAAIFSSSLSGISWVASSGFYMADKWAFDRMSRLGADPLAAYSLHFKLASSGETSNAFVFDEERLNAMTTLAGKGGIGDRAKLALAGNAADAIANAGPARPVVEVRSLDAPPPVALAPRETAQAAAQSGAEKIVTLMVEGTRYTGRFRQDAGMSTITGEGSIVWANGDQFEGQVIRGQRQGKGKLTWANGQRYEGDWKDDIADGTGTFYYPSGIRYTGDVSKGAPNGMGRIEFASGDAYEGAVVDAFPHGKGVFIWGNGDKWTGTFEKGNQVGEGDFVAKEQIARK